LKDPSVSRNHALLIAQNGELRVKDLGSTNGSYVNGRRLEEGLMRLHSGDRLTIGESDLIIGVTGEAPVEDPNLATRRMDPDGVRCPHCGAPLDLSLVECPGCGKSLLDEPMAETSAPTRERSLPPVVEILAKPETRREPLESPPGPPLARPDTDADADPARHTLHPRAEGAGEAAQGAAAPEAAEPASDELLPSLDALDGFAAPVPPAPLDPSRSSPSPTSPTSPTSSTSSTSPDPAIAPGPSGTAAPAASPRAPAAGTPPSLPPAGFGIRLAATVVDGLVILLLGVGASFLQGGPLRANGQSLLSLVTLALWVLVPVFGWSLWGATPGKALFGLKVCGRNGRAGIPPGQAILRLLGYGAGVLSLGIGFLMVAFTEGKRGLHDVIAGTFVGRRG
jgi:uncharacterized RDD family membrane protein YckC/pSer/pThr/pTyr-binding forkhead associated (FHA) protein